MKTRRYQKTLDRHQEMVLPPSVDEYISHNNIARAIDAYVDTLSIIEFGFTNTQPVTGPGQPAYDPAALMKVYLYGYIQGIRSSRKLERETIRNPEVIWLIKGLQPSYKTIADFRKNNIDVLKSVNRDFVLLCKELSLFSGEEVAVDGGFFSGNASKGSICTEEKPNKQIESPDKKIAAYQDAISKQDAAMIEKEKEVYLKMNIWQKNSSYCRKNKRKNRLCRSNSRIVQKSEFQR